MVEQWPRLYVSLKTKGRMAKLAKKKKSTIKDMTEKVLAAGLKTLHL